MSEFKGTPGPWKFEVTSTGRYEAVYYDESFHRYFSVVGFGVDEAPENARLISAAPDLIEALLAIRDLKNGTEMTYEDAYDSMFKSGGRDAWHTVDAAIAKALQP